MLFDSALSQELRRAVLATAAVILTIVLTTMLIRTLGQAAAGAVSPRDVVLVLAFAALGFVPLILSLSLFVGIIATLTRMYRDSEMAVWFASGVGLMRFVRPVLATVLPAVLLVALAGLVARPWGQAQLQELRDRYERRSDLSKVSPGEFQSSRDGRRVFYIDRRGEDAVVGTNVFILASGDRREYVTTAREGRVVLEGDRRLLALTHGQRTSWDTGTGERGSAEFAQARVEIDDHAPTPDSAPEPRALSSLALAFQRGAPYQAELAWRVGLVLSAINLALLAVGLASGSARQKSNWTLVNGLLAFVAYINLTNLVQAWSTSGRLAAWPATLALHLGVAAVALGLLAWRQRGAGNPSLGQLFLHRS